CLYGLVFYEPLPLAMGLLFMLFVLRALWLGQIAWPRLLSQVPVIVATWLTTYAAVRLIFGFDLISRFRQVGLDAVQFNRDVGRAYSVWIWGDLREFVFGIGICQAILFCAALADGIAGGTTWRERL